MERDPIYRRADIRIRMHELLSRQIIVEEVNLNEAEEEPQMSENLDHLKCEEEAHWKNEPVATPERNVHRFRSLGDVVVALSSEDVPSLFQLRQYAYNRLAEAQEDIRVVEEEIAARDDSDATLQLGNFGQANEQLSFPDAAA